MVKGHKIIARVALISGSQFLAPFIASAATLPNSCDAFLGLLNRIAFTFSAFIFAIAIIMVLVAAFQFLTAGGDAAKATTARGTLVWAVIGLAVALLAFSVPSIVVSFFGGALLTNCG